MTGERGWDLFDAGEFAGLAGVVAWCWLAFGWHAAVLAGSLVLLLEVQTRSRGRSPVRARPARRRLAAAVRAGLQRWREDDAA